MANRMKGQFYVLAALMVGMYIFFLLRIFTSTKTAFETPEIPQVSYLHEAIQECVDEGERVEPVLEAINFIPEPVGLRCTGLGNQRGTCSLERDEWACGVNVTVVYRGRTEVSVTKVIYPTTFDIQADRTPIYLRPNETANLVEISEALSHGGVVKDTDGNTLPASWNGNTVTLRTNLVKDSATTLFVYNASTTSSEVYEDVGVLNDDGYDGTTIYGKLSGLRDTEYLKFSDFDNLGRGTGPRMLFLSDSYPDTYGSSLLQYIKEGGILVAPYGLCKTTGVCLTGNLEELTNGHYVTAVDDFSSLNPPNTNSDYFTNPDIPWLVYNESDTLNNSRAAAGATAYGEGFVVFIGNKSMLSTWSKSDDFLNELLAWGVNPVSVTQTECPVQTP